jgi:hypothetical protein
MSPLYNTLHFTYPYQNMFHTGSVITQFVWRLATGCTSQESGFDSRKDKRLYCTAFRPALGATQPTIQSVPGVKRLEHEADHCQDKE